MHCDFNNNLRKEPTSTARWYVKGKKLSSAQCPHFSHLPVLILQAGAKRGRSHHGAGDPPRDPSYQTPPPGNTKHHHQHNVTTPFSVPPRTQCPIAEGHPNANAEHTTREHPPLPSPLPPSPPLPPRCNRRLRWQKCSVRRNAHPPTNI